MERHGWISLGEAYLQQQPIYDLTWNLPSLEAFHVAISYSGAFIATARNDKVPLLVPSYASLMQPISIFSGSGTLLRSIPWDREHNSILKLGWTGDSRCVAVLDDATMRLYALSGIFETFDLGLDVKEHGIFSCMIHPDGMVIATRKGKFLVISNWELPIPKVYSHFTAPEYALAHWTSIGPTTSPSGSLEIFLSLPDHLVIITEFNVETKNLPGIRSISVSPSLNFWACHTHQNNIEIRLAHAEQREGFFSLQPYLETSDSPIQIAWCGDDAVIIATSTSLTFLHISCQAFTSDLFEPVFLSSALDSCFILSTFEMTLVTPVHHTCQHIFQIGSKHPGAILMDCLNQYQSKSSQTMELVETLVKDSQLYTAISACLEASLYTWDIKLQKQLFQAAQFGRAWCASISIRDTLVSTYQKLRVMNALRRIGIPCTLALFNKLGFPGTLDLLLAAHQHALAYQIATTFHLKTMKIVTHWAKLKITMAKEYDVDALVATLVERLKVNENKVHHAELAKTAYASGHLDLATKLLNFETRPHEQIPLLLEMNQSELALEKAVDTLDSDLENDRALLRDFFFLDDRHKAMGELLIDDVQTAATIEEKISLLRDAITCFSRSKRCQSEQKSTEQYLDLLHRQAVLNGQYPDCVTVGDSLYQTIFHLVEHGHLDHATKLKTVFHMSEYRFSWIVVRAYINVRRLSDLEAFAQRNKRPPSCGYSAIAQELINAKIFEEAKKYILKCELHHRISFYLQMNCFLEAAQACYQLNDLTGLTEVRAKTTDATTAQQIDHLIHLLKNK